MAAGPSDTPPSRLAIEETPDHLRIYSPNRKRLFASIFSVAWAVFVFWLAGGALMSALSDPADAISSFFDNPLVLLLLIVPIAFCLLAIYLLRTAYRNYFGFEGLEITGGKVALVAGTRFSWTRDEYGLADVSNFRIDPDALYPHGRPNIPRESRYQRFGQGLIAFDHRGDTFVFGREFDLAEGQYVLKTIRDYLA